MLMCLTKTKTKLILNKCTTCVKSVLLIRAEDYAITQYTTIGNVGGFDIIGGKKSPCPHELTATTFAILALKHISCHWFDYTS